MLFLKNEKVSRLFIGGEDVSKAYYNGELIFNKNQRQYIGILYYRIGDSTTENKLYITNIEEFKKLSFGNHDFGWDDIWNVSYNNSRFNFNGISGEDANGNPVTISSLHINHVTGWEFNTDPRSKTLYQNYNQIDDYFLYHAGLDSYWNSNHVITIPYWINSIGNYFMASGWAGASFERTKNMNNPIIFQETDKQNEKVLLRIGSNFLFAQGEFNRPLDCKRVSSVDGFFLAMSDPTLGTGDKARYGFDSKFASNLTFYRNEDPQNSGQYVNFSAGDYMLHSNRNTGGKSGYTITFPANSTLGEKYFGYIDEGYLPNFKGTIILGTDCTHGDDWLPAMTSSSDGTIVINTDNVSFGPDKDYYGVRNQHFMYKTGSPQNQITVTGDYAAQFKAFYPNFTDDGWSRRLV